MQLLAFLCVAVAGLSGFATATTYVVHPDGTGDFATIQAAIDAVVDGDVVSLTDGTFTGDGNRDMDFLGKAITIQSQSGDPATCVIDCQGTEADPHRGFQFRNGEQDDSVLMGVTIRGGWVVYPLIGGAISCDGGCAPSIGSCIISGNRGTAVGCSHGSALSLADCLVTDNQGSFGAGICAERCQLTIHNCTFSENSGEDIAGALFGYSVDAVLTNCAFVGNTAHREAGATFTDGSQVEIRDCLFEGNVSASSGAALTFWLSGPNTVERCTFVGNTAQSEGAAIWSEKVSETYVRNCTFWGNGSPHGAVLAGNYRFVMENCLVAFSTEGPGVASHYDYAELSCCDIYGNAGGDWVGTIEDQLGINGNICEDPLFCDPAAGDFYLDCSSPCAPFSPPNPECDLIGAWPVGCGGSPAVETTWGAVKALFGE